MNINKPCFENLYRRCCNIIKNSSDKNIKEKQLKLDRTYQTLCRTENCELQEFYSIVLELKVYEFLTSNNINLIVADDSKEGPDFECEFGRIDWYAMHSNKATRYFSFNNNGIIQFSKSTKTGKGPTLKHPNRISYDTSFNVLSNDFDISITLNQLTGDLGKKYKYDYLLLSLKDNILIEKFNDIEIIRNLSTGKKVVRIIKKRVRTMPNYSSVVFEAALNPDNSLEFGNVTINTYKSNGKVNETYRFDASRKKGICANFYSRKGIKIDLINNPDLLNTANALLLPTPSNQNSGDIIVSNFVNATQNAIAKNSSEKVISFDNFDFNIEAIQQAETKIIEIVKCIKGELPLFGLVERINNCLNLIDKKKHLKVTTKSRTLKPKVPNN